MWLLVLLISLMPVSSFANTEAESCGNCLIDNTAKTNSLNDLEEVAAKLNSCESAYEREASANYQRDFGDKRQQKTEMFGNLKISGHKDELIALKAILGAKPPANWSEKARSCDTAVCILEKIVGTREAAFRMLSFHKRTGYTISIDQNSNPVGVEFIWPPQEVRMLDRAFSKVPASFLKLPTLDIIRRVPKGYISVRNPRAAASASMGISVGGSLIRKGNITVYEQTFADKSPQETFAILIHELAHHVDFTHHQKTGSYKSDLKPFRNLSGWTTNQKIKEENGRKIIEETHRHDQKVDFVTEYSKTDPMEDFAEASAYYVTNPQLLKRVDPSKYDYLKSNIFGGKEYLEMPESVRIGATQELVLKCLSSLKKINPGRFGFEISNTADKQIQRHFTFDKDTPKYDIAKLNCLPPINQSGENLALCDLGSDEAVSKVVYAKVIDSLTNLFDKNLDDKRLRNQQEKCFKQNNFTSACYFSDLDLPPELEASRQEIQAAMASKFVAAPSYGGRNLYDSAITYLPNERMTIACMNEFFSELTYSDSRILYKRKASKEWSFWSIKLECSSEVAAASLLNEIKYDDIRALTNGVMESKKSDDFKNSVFEAFKNTAPGCKKLFSGFNKECLVEGVIKALPETPVDPVVLKEEIKKLADKFK